MKKILSDSHPNPSKERTKNLLNNLNISIFPYGLARVSGGPYDDFESLHIKNASEIATKIYLLEIDLEKLKVDISELLHTIIGDLPNSTERLSLIHLRRDIFNGRRFSLENVEQLQNNFSSDILRKIKGFSNIQREIQKLHEEGQAIYQLDVQNIRKNLRDLANKDNLQKGLLLASHSLLTNCLKYLENNSGKPNKKELKTERSLLKYLSRIYAKTSPFSTFTNITVAKIDPLPENEFFKSADLPSSNRDHLLVKSFIRLNNKMFGHFKRLLKQNTNYFRWFPIKINSTLSVEKDHYKYLTNSHNVEAFQRIEINPALEKIVSVLTSKKNAAVIYEDLVEAMIKDTDVAASRENIEAYIHQLTEYGLLHFDIGVSDLDPDWNKKLHTRLAKLPDNLPHIADLLSFLKVAGDLLEDYVLADINRRKEIIEHLYNQFKRISEKLEQETSANINDQPSPDSIENNIEDISDEQEKTNSKDSDNLIFIHQDSTSFSFRKEYIFFEDTSIDSSILLNQTRIQDIISKTHQILEQIRIFDIKTDEQIKMLYYFNDHYDASESVDLLTFYEKYYRDFKKIEVEFNKQRNHALEALHDLQKPKEAHEQYLPIIKERFDIRNSWKKRLSQIFKQLDSTIGNPINLTLDQVANITRDVVPNTLFNCDYQRSEGIFVQFFTEETEEGQSKLMGVVNGSFPGFGKLQGRFLHIFDEYLTTAFREWNSNNNKRGDLLAEITDASFFNANIHPPLLPYEIWMPNSQNMLPVDQQLLITDIKVTLDNNKNSLHLIHKKNQKRILPFSLALEISTQRSQLSSLLENFSPLERLFHGEPLGFVDQGPSNDYGENQALDIWVRPRFIIEDQLILQRKAWNVPENRLPYKKSDQNDWDYFYFINEWRQQLGIPEETFIYIMTKREISNVVKSTSGNSISLDHRKPQYINFSNPLFVDLFGRLLHKVSSNLTIEEMLPNSKQLFEINGKKHVTEFIIQWYVDPTV